MNYIDDETGRVHPVRDLEPSTGPTIYDSAVALVRTERRCDLAFLQKRLGIGEIVAAACVERMVQAGIVGKLKADGTREVEAP